MSNSGLIKSGYEIVKSSLKSLIYPQEIPIEPKFNLDPNVYPNDEFGQSAEKWYFFGNNFDAQVPINFESYDNQIVAFRKCPPLSTIIKRKTIADLNGKRFIMNSAKKEATSQYAKAIRAKMSKPNILQNWRSFRAQQKIYIQTHGFCILFATFPTGYERLGLTEATSLWNIPPCMVKIKLTGKLYSQTDISSVIEYIKMGDTYLPLENIFIFRDSGATSFKSSFVFPDSRICDLQLPISNVIYALDSRNTLIRRRGALGVLSPRAKDGTGAITIPLKPDEKKELQREWRQYGTSSNQENILISNAAVDWTRISMDVKELMLHEEVEGSSMMICDQYGFPPHLLGLLDPTFNNQATAEKGLYQNTIIPEAESDDATWNEAFKTEENNLSIETDFSHLPILQEGADRKASARNTLDLALEREFKNNLITLNRWLELLGEDTKTGGDVYYSDMLNAGNAFGFTQVNPEGHLETSSSLNGTPNGTTNGTVKP